MKLAASSSHAKPLPAHQPGLAVRLAVVSLCCAVGWMPANALAQIDVSGPLRWVHQVWNPPAAVSSQPHPAVVRVIVPDATGSSLGSGTLVDVNHRFGLVLTNWHVIADATGAPTVVFPDGFRSSALVVKSDRDWDLAALVIWRPRAQPVALANVVPRPGDWLTIAGYGSGKYRAATARCTQYLSPGPQFPAEMVELGTAARQGDSGGPIFNAQGELAGVLFGASLGSTSGSHCLRVQKFLQGVLPAQSDQGQLEQSLASVSTAERQIDSPPPEMQQPDAAPPPGWTPAGAGRDPSVAGPVTLDTPQPFTERIDVASDRRIDVAADVFQFPSEPHSAVNPGLPVTAAFPPPGASQGAQATGSTSDVIAELFGRTRWEQTKSVLAAVALVLITLQAQGVLATK